MTSPVQICNLALGRLGSRRVTSITNPATPTEQLCKDYYDAIRRSLLETGYFAFAYERAIMSTPSTEAPAWGYGYAFDIPSTVLKVWSVRRDTSGHRPSMDDEVEFAQVGNQIHTNESRVFVEYIIDEKSSFSDLFVQAFQLRLASEMCMQVTENRTLQEHLEGQYERKMDEAAGHDNQIQQKRQQRTSRLISSRGRGFAGRGGAR